MGLRGIYCLFGLVVVIAAVFAFTDSTQAGLIGYWTFDNGSADAEPGYGQNGSLEGTTGQPTATKDRNEVDNGALAFNGAGEQYVSIPGGGGLAGAQAGTISMWVKWVGTQDQSGSSGQWGYGTVLARQGVLPERDIWSDNVLGLDAASPAAAKVRWTNNENDPTPLYSLGAVNETWHHIGVVFQGDYLGNTTLYVDGTWQGEFEGDSLALLPTDMPLTVGGWAGATCWSTSSIDDVAIFDDMLDAIQIGQLADKSETPLTVGGGTSPGKLPISGVTATASTYFGGAQWYSRHPYFACNGMGRKSNKYDGAGGATAYYGSDEEATSHQGLWLTARNDPDDWIQFDLGEEVALDELVLWNYNEGNGTKRGFKTADISYSTNGTDWTLLGNESFTQSTGVDGVNSPQSVDMQGVTARYVKFHNIVNFGDNSYTGVSEVDFYAVPEPSTAILLLCAALGLLALQRRV